jgi:hypothetical protein
MKLARILHAVLFLLCLTALAQDVRAEQAEQAKQAGQAEQKTAVKPPVDIGTFLQEAFKLKVGGNMSDLAAWLPFEFYVESAFAEGGQSKELLSKDFQFIEPYLTIIVQSSVDQLDGTASYESEEAIRARAVLRQKDGAEVKPLTDKEIPQRGQHARPGVSKQGQGRQTHNRRHKEGQAGTGAETRQAVQRDRVYVAHPV